MIAFCHALWPADKQNTYHAYTIYNRMDGYSVRILVAMSGNVNLRPSIMQILR